MAATRLSDAQKQDIVGRYQGGASSTELAEAFGCSPNTVSRVVKAALSPEDYAQLKQQRLRSGRAASSSSEAPELTSTSPVETAASPEESPRPGQATHQGDDQSDNSRSGDGQPEELQPWALQADAEPAAPPDPSEAPTPAPEAPVAEAADPSFGQGLEPSAENAGSEEPGVLAIDDADDFGDDEGEEDGDDEGVDLGDADDEEAEESDDLALVHEPVQCRCLSEAQLPSSAYLLVDKTVELQPTPLSDYTELGPLPAEEAERQALLVYGNPRQAKRHCGRSQRVIQLPDVSILQRTAPYLLAQGISRVVIDGSLYSLPGS